MSVAGLVDTGAERTAIPRHLAVSLGLPVHDWEMVQSAAGGEPRLVPVYLVRLSFAPNDAPARWRSITAVGVASVSPGAMILVGRDMLSTCRFTYDGRGERLVMSY